MMEQSLLQRARENAARRNMSFDDYLRYVQRVALNPHNDLSPAEQWDAMTLSKLNEAQRKADYDDYVQDNSYP